MPAKLKIQDLRIIEVAKTSCPWFRCRKTFKLKCHYGGIRIVTSMTER
ncbi:hypothetical protein QO004_004137 [Rhizobium mesoamericanum]|nr:hypothetical protein [Rhizobium mesoamericanum]